MLRNLVVSGGSSKTIAVLGAIRYLEEHALLYGIRNMIGTSAGSILLFMLALGYNTRDMLHLLQDHFLGNDLQSLTLDEIGSLGMLTSFGMDSGKNITVFLEDCLFLSLHCKEITFRDLVKHTGINFVVCVANLSKCKTEYMCVDNSPDLNVVTAVRMSCSLPYIFTPVIYNDCYYVDGGIYEMLPISYIDMSRDTMMDTIAINTMSKNADEPIESFLDYTRVLFTSIIAKVNSNIVTNKKIKLVNIEFDGEQELAFSFDKMNFAISDTLIENYVNKGYEIMKKCFE